MRTVWKVALTLGLATGDFRLPGTGGTSNGNGGIPGGGGTRTPAPSNVVVVDPRSDLPRRRCPRSVSIPRAATS